MDILDMSGNDSIFLLCEFQRLVL